MKHDDVKGWTILNLTSTSLFDLISSNEYHATNLTELEWTGLIPTGSSLLPAEHPQCRIQGINVVGGDTGVRIGIIGSKYCLKTSPQYDSRLGFGGKGGSCGQDHTNTCGNEVRCGVTISKKTIGYILVK
jgi:hypothetical protein